MRQPKIALLRPKDHGHAVVDSRGEFVRGGSDVGKNSLILNPPVQILPAVPKASEGEGVAAGLPGAVFFLRGFAGIVRRQLLSFVKSIGWNQVLAAPEGAAMDWAVGQSFAARVDGRVAEAIEILGEAGNKSPAHEGEFAFIDGVGGGRRG
jgi:hypothetical protein